MPAAPQPALAVLFDLDGVITDTSELHYQSWQRIADELGVPFDRRANEALRGLGRRESLAVLLGERFEALTEAQRADLLDRKNADYLQRVARLGPQDIYPGITGLMNTLAAAGARLAVASSSRNARAVLGRLGLTGRLDAVVDGNDAPRSKPDPQVFLVAAERVGMPPDRCVVIEDAASGVEAALAAGMAVVGVGPSERVGRAQVRVDRPEGLSAATILSLVGKC